MPITINVMCWNIDLGQGSGEINSALPAIADQIVANNPDVVLLSEVRRFGSWWPGGVDQTADLAQRTGIANFAFGALATTGLTGWQGNAVLSRHPIRGEVMHKVMRGPSETTFGIFEVTLSVQGVEHRVFSARFTPYDDVDNFEGHRLGVRLVGEVNSRAPILFGGDFNARLPTEQAQYFVTNSGLTDVSVGNLDPTPCLEPGQTISDAVDRLYYRGPYQASNFRLRCPWGEPGASDHPWIFATLVESQPLECETLRNAISALTQQVLALRDAKVGLDPRNPADRAEIRAMNEQIYALESERRLRRQEADGLGCVF